MKEGNQFTGWTRKSVTLDEKFSKEIEILKETEGNKKLNK
jgi:hypothetical protein